MGKKNVVKQKGDSWHAIWREPNLLAAAAQSRSHSPREEKIMRGDLVQEEYDLDGFYSAYLH